ncbi:hypothetical protein DdX_17193 [Ditylenchus destructor]|uniref:Uncharacterized protein n=1 Tax=Ditylenchus destructor TaxID=166010 RepID=A0AAD4QZ77_9BILA|nr:hypothetical protein DdX_17193 [Ditylenchus destructor]
MPATVCALTFPLKEGRKEIPANSYPANAFPSEALADMEELTLINHRMWGRRTVRSSRGLIIEVFVSLFITVAVPVTLEKRSDADIGDFIIF